ncbi:hypothetical protein BOX15_Mlig025656g3 [Macrostomum lignano]|uniref:Sodium/calcium exchanger membrane region domain-containing protein n=1 Tax=Macrostomum lignano TaxID=282301 RepID=A0A267GEZ5_9PLAT|nr:hypothetical protein BOX15_Mlig025656g3 [Macrostomum lignano]
MGPLVTSGFDTSELACSDVIHNNTLWGNDANTLCQLVNATESCIFNDGHIEYLLGMYCVFKDVVPLGVTLMFLWLIMMLIGLATTADVFFGPCLIVMADTMRLSQNVAGVTLLALGNGAPDIFSAISSITTLKDGDAGLAFGALLGAGIFVTAVTAGAIAIVKPFTAMSRPLMKDIVFYMFTIFWAFIVMFRQTITLVDSIGFIVLYVLYVILTVVSRALYSQGIGAGSKEGQAGTEAVAGAQDEDPAAGGSEAFRMRSRSDIQQNVGAVYANDNPAFNSEMEADAAAGYDTSLDFPGGLQRAEPDESKTARSRRFQELDVHSSPKTSVARKPSRLDERMKRVSRVQMQKLSRTGQESFGEADGVVSGGRKRSQVGRKVSTASFTGVERRANYLTRWMLVYGNLEQVEHRSRSSSQVSHDGHPAAAAPSPAPARSVSVARPPPQAARQQPAERRVSDSYRPGTSSGGGGGGSSGSAMIRPGYKLSGGLGMDAASAYFQKKESEQQARKLSKQQQRVSQTRQPPSPPAPQPQQEEEDDENRKRQLYRIESVDEALDDDTVDRLNRLNEQRMMEERQREREEREAAAAAQEAAAAERQDAGEDDEVDENQSPIKEFLYSLVPVDLEEFPEMTWYNKVYEIIKAPLLFLLLLSTPFVDYDQPLNGWSRILNSVHCAIAPVFIALAFKGYNWMIPFEGGGGFPIVVIVLIVGIALGILVYFTSSDFEPPKYHAAFAFIGFLTAIVWIYTFANEVVNILESVGSIFRISSTILGLTVLAWANSIGDVIANTVLARQNFPRVAISACFGGPLFNLLLGVGIPFTIKLLSDGTTEMRIEASVVQLLLVVSVTASLIVSMVYLTVMRFKLGRVYGIILIVLYLAFLVVALLAETGQLPPLIDRN